VLFISLVFEVLLPEDKPEMTKQSLSVTTAKTPNQ
jgi:hypothetical protein